jgi:predicted Zn-dependent protease
MVYFQRDEAVAGYNPSLAEDMASCLDEWVSASNGKFSWVQTSQPEQANVIIRWTENTVQRACGNEVGQTKTFTRFNTLTNHGVIKSAEVSLSTRFSNHEPSKSEIRRMYLHEAGHIFGIAGHSHNRDDVMYFTVAAGNAACGLSERDKDTMRRLYEGDLLVVSKP